MTLVGGLQVENEARGLAEATGVAADTMLEDDEEDDRVWISASGDAKDGDVDGANSAASGPSSSSGGGGGDGKSSSIIFPFSGCVPQAADADCHRKLMPWVCSVVHHSAARSHARILQMISAALGREPCTGGCSSQLRRGAWRGDCSLLQTASIGPCLADWRCQGRPDGAGGCVHHLAGEARGKGQKQLL